MIKAKNFSISQLNFGLFFLLELSQLKYTTQTFDLDVLVRLRRLCDDSRLKSAVPLLFEFSLSSLLSYTSLLGLKLVLQIL